MQKTTGLGLENLVKTLIVGQVLFLTFLFIETYLKWLFFAFILVLIIFLFYKKQIAFEDYKDKRLLIWLTIYAIFLITTLIASLFTQNIPQSIDALSVKFFISLLLFSFVFIKKELFSKKEMLFSLLFASLFIQALSLFFFFLPVPSVDIPGMNLVFATYGHNHGIKLLLLFNPLLLYLINYKKRQYLPLYFFFIFISVLISFSRLAFVVFIFQTVVFLLEKNKEMKKGFLYSISTILILSVVLLALVNTNKIKCELDTLDLDKICKSIDTEKRPEYWSQAIHGFRDRPFVGSGAGTFGIVSNRYKQLESSYTSYAHNFILTTLAESGVFSFLVLICFLVYSVYLFIGSKALDKEKKVYGLSLISFLFFGLFDFDWQFVAISLSGFSIFMYSISNERKKKIQNSESKHIQLFIKVFFIAVLFILSCLTFLYIVSESLIFTNNEKALMKTFPYFLNHKLIFFDSFSEGSTNFDAIKYIYRSDLNLYTNNTVKNNMEDQEYNSRLLALDKFTFLKEIKNDGTYSSELNAQYETAISLLDSTPDEDKLLYHQAAMNFFSFSFAQDIPFEQKMFYFTKAVQLSPWVLHFYNEKKFIADDAEDCKLLETLEDVDAEPFGDNRLIYSYAFTYCANKTSDYAIRERYIKKAIELVPWREDQIVL